MTLPQEKRYTYADLLQWDENERIEIIDGEPVMMSPPRTVHQLVLVEILTQFKIYLHGKKCQVIPAPFGVRLFEQPGDAPEDVDTLVEPDITLVCDPAKLDDAGCKGAPDLIVEILSPTTQRHDRLTKYNLYQRAGVQEYWIVDPDAQVVLVHTLEEGQYHAAMAYNAAAAVPVGVLEDCAIDLAQVFSQIP